MTRPVADYVAMALINDSSQAEPFSRTAKNFSGDYAELKTYAEDVCKIKMSESVLNSAIRTLSECGLVRVTDDNFSGDYYKVHGDKFPNFIEKAQDQINKFDSDNEINDILLGNRSDYPEAYAFLHHGIIEDYNELGENWLDRALTGIRTKLGDEILEIELPNSSEINTTPASDRLVTIDHNSRSFNDMVDVTEVASEAIRSSNSLDEENRGWIRAHIEAGLEFVKNHKILTAAASALLLKPLLNAYEAVTEEPAKQAILAAIKAISSFFGISN